MNEWQVFKRGHLYRVGRWYRTFFLRRWKIQWYYQSGYCDDYIYVAHSREGACKKAEERNDDEIRWAKHYGDHWKPVSCDYKTGPS